MNCFEHKFGQFYETVRVDGKNYNFEDYKNRSKPERNKLQQEAVERCVAANRLAGWSLEKKILIDGNTYPAAVYDVFKTWEFMIETDWERFERYLSTHNWFYEYSDNFSIWQRGKNKHQEIITLMKQLGPEAENLYKQKYFSNLKQK